MTDTIILYKTPAAVDNLCRSTDSSLNVLSITDHDQTLDIVESGTIPIVAIIDYDTIQSNKSCLLDLLTIIPSTTFILWCREQDLSSGVIFAGTHSFFRIITEQTDRATFKQILSDAGKQYNVFQGLPQNIDINKYDLLTGCANRSQIFSLLKKQITRAARYAQHLSVIICDIDGLKDINDFMGYDIGDGLLQHFTNHINNQIRVDIDIAGRWGEDSFLIICPETALRGAGKLAERLKETLQENMFFHKKSKVKIKASYGISSYAPNYPDHNNTPEQLILLAERCLAQAKAAGGDNILCCP